MNHRKPTVIQGAKKQIISDLSLGTRGKIHVVAYAHVPMGKNQDEELRSFFEPIISNLPKWELINIMSVPSKTVKLIYKYTLIILFATIFNYS